MTLCITPSLCTGGLAKPQSKRAAAPQIKKTMPMSAAAGAEHGDFMEEALPHLEAVHSFALSLARNRSTAEELAQETFLRAYRAFHSFKKGTNCKAWLFRICKNLFIDSRRRKQRSNQHAVEDLEVPAYDLDWQQRALQRSQMGEATAMEDLFGDEILEGLEDLPESFREALLLCDVDGLSYQEISEQLNIPIGTVRSRISRGRNLLKDSLAGYAEKQGFGKAAS